MEINQADKQIAISIAESTKIIVGITKNFDW